MLTSSIFDRSNPQPLPVIQPTDDEDDDGGAIDGNVLGEVVLAKKPGMSLDRIVDPFNVFVG